MAKKQHKAQGEARPARKLTAKQEAFACAYVETGNASEAYRRCYNAGNMPPESVWVKACEVMKNVKVTLRVEELKAALAEKHEITVELITEGYLKSALIADEDRNPAALTGAYTALGKLHGLIIEKSSNVNGVRLAHSIILRRKLMTSIVRVGEAS